MTENEAIKELKNENEQCYEQCEGCCSEIQENICTCRDAIIISALEQYQAIGTVEECQMAKKRLIPKKAVIGKIFKTMGYYQCPVCRGLLMRNEKFCNDCGQRIG